MPFTWHHLVTPTTDIIHWHYYPTPLGICHHSLTFFTDSLYGRLALIQHVSQTLQQNVPQSQFYPNANTTDHHHCLWKFTFLPYVLILLLCRLLTRCDGWWGWGVSGGGGEVGWKSYAHNLARLLKVLSPEARFASPPPNKAVIIFNGNLGRQLALVPSPCDRVWHDKCKFLWQSLAWLVQQARVRGSDNNNNNYNNKTSDRVHAIGPGEARVRGFGNNKNNKVTGYLR